ncbi:citrate:proton symporter [Lachnospiraceae bacterium OttesenSCG-928-D06]|nr:citrate:proton symporter [Lachnospiraceae bacterium OttesenSCG-928-D06]
MTYLGIAGFVLMFLIVALLLYGKTIPAVVFIILPIVVGLLVGFTPLEMSEYIAAGVSSVANTAVLFIFAVVFFGIMSDAGVFERIVNKVIKYVGNNVLLLLLATILIAVIGHLDGSGATTFLITIPPLLPIYKKLNVRPVVLLGITSLTMGVMNIVPWGGPCGRVAATLEVGTSEIWKCCIPAQIVGIAVIAGLCVLFAYQEKKRGAGQIISADVTVETSKEAEKNDLQRPKLFWVNIILIIAVVLMLTLTEIPTHITFMIALAIGMIINYPSQKAQQERLKAHATNALTMAFTVVASGALIGIMSKSPMLDAMTQIVLSFMPQSMASHLHVLFAAINSPLSMVIQGDALVFGILPIVNQIVAGYGIPAAAVGAAFLITFGPAIYIMPMTAATYMGLGFAEVDLKDHIIFSYKWAFVLSVIMLAFVVIVGIIPF